MRLIPALLALTLTTAPASAQSWSSSSTVTPNDPRDIARRAPVISETQAGAIALKRVPGKLLGAMIETNDGIRTWQVDVQANDGHKVRMWLNASTGAFLKSVDR
jgi:uncharacterized membrane protein YkoI